MWNKSRMRTMNGDIRIDTDDDVSIYGVMKTHSGNIYIKGKSIGIGGLIETNNTGNVCIIAQEEVHITGTINSANVFIFCTTFELGERNKPKLKNDTRLLIIVEHLEITDMREMQWISETNTKICHNSLLVKSKK